MGVDVKFSLFYVAWKVGRQHICLHVLKVMIKRGVVFDPDHLENSLITSQNVMDLSFGILFVQAFLEFYIHPPAWIGPGYRMEQPNVLRKLVHSAGRQ